MNLPNRLTLIRMALVPLCCYLITLDTTLAGIFALVVFALASFTDFLDGWIARKHHIVTVLGQFLDSIADKFLVLSTMITLCTVGRFPVWACIIILFRDLFIDALRQVAAAQGKVIPAGILGKIKTVSQMLLLIACLVDMFLPLPSLLLALMLSVSVVMTLWSGLDYFQKNKGAFAMSQENNDE